MPVRESSLPFTWASFCSRPRHRRAARLVSCALAVVALTHDVHGQGFGGPGFGFQPVGGISIDTDGVVRTVDAKALDESVRAMRTAVTATKLPAPAGETRTVSLAGIMAAVKEAVDGRSPIPVDVALLGGLERITHVFVVPEERDILLMGPADIPVVDACGTPVGKRNGRPLLRLEDLVVALRAADQSKAGGVFCSIDPTPRGLAQLQEFLAAQKTMGRNPAAVFRGMEEALGPQTVTVGGVPGDSRFARVLVGADHAMKRIGMGHEPSGIKELPSYLSLVKAGVRASSLPRFWLEAEYEPLARDADELTWQIRGRRMKCLSAGGPPAGDGIRRGIGQRDESLEVWCQAMTEHYDRLTARHPVFAELVNCVDLAVVAALIRSRQLDARAGLDLRGLTDESLLGLPKYEVAKSVATVANGLKKGTNWVLSASGGVLLRPWQFAGNTMQVDGLDTARAAATAARPQGPSASACWWD
jgi:hypothetical protein